jgi:hypothetical protein
MDADRQNADLLASAPHAARRDGGIVMKFRGGVEVKRPDADDQMFISTRATHKGSWMDGYLTRQQARALITGLQWALRKPTAKEADRG